MAEPKDDVEFMREIVKKAFWDILYHERELRISHVNVSHAKALLTRGNYKFTVEEALNSYDEETDEFVTSDDWIKNIVGGASQYISYHEEGMAEGHANLAIAKIMIARGKYTEIDVDKIRSETEEKLKK